MDYERLINTRLFLLDMDGTLYLGDDVFDGAVDFIHSISETGRNYIYLTNNSSRAGVDYITRLRKLGFPCEAENVFTSGMATGEYLNQNYPGAKVYLAGTKAFYRELQSYGIDLVNDENGHTDVDTVDVVVQGFDTELVYEKLDLACHFLRRGAKFIAANPDWVCPMPADEVLPDCGSICALLTAASGVKPEYIGKPNRNMIDVVSKMTGVPNENICAVGDRLYTDIAVAKNAGSVSVCVLSGESSEQDIAESEVKPDYVLQNVAEIAKILRAAEKK
ncbi:MAG: HAD-IIA family hydrolase [Oscillospiraceae bacterium]|nr:HAD-IIA family hydrolase [Oscillospiraceae bacterium]